MAEAVAFNAQTSLLLLLRQAGVLVVLAASIALGLYVALWARTPEYEVLFTDLADRDLSEVIDNLRSQQVPYRMDANGHAVLVPAEHLQNARLKLAADGLPRNSVGAGFDDAPAFGTSQFMEQARYQRSIEAELARSVAGISNVRAARVHLALPKQSAFARNKSNPTASVIVDLYGGRPLEAYQVGAITHMVSAGVAGLSPDQVTVIDQRGNLLTDAAGGTDDMMLSAKHFEYTRTLEQSFIDRVEAILSPLVGADGVRAQVTADIDFTATEQTRESFNPDLPAIRSESTLEEERSGAGGSGGVPGALSNEPPGPATAPENTAATDAAVAPDAAVAATSAAAGNRRNQTTRNYELDRTISHTRPATGSIRRLSVAVVVRNPTPTEAAPASGAAAPAAGAPADPNAAAPAAETAAGFSDAELERMNNLVKEAIGFDAGRGDSVRITNADFLTPPVPEPMPATPLWERPWVWSVGKQALAGVFALFVLFGVIRPTMKSLMSKPLPAGSMSGSGAAGGALEHTTGSAAALSGPSAAVSNALPALPGVTRQADGRPLLVSSDIDPNIDQVKQFVSQDPRVAAQVIKGWVGD